MKDIVIYGAGGSGRELACVLKKINQVEPTWNLLGFIDDGLSIGTANEYGKVIGNIDFINTYDKPLSVAITIGNPNVIKRIVENITNSKIEYPNIIDPDVKFLDKDFFKIGKGNILFNNVLLSINTSLGDFNFLDSCECGHDSSLGDYNVVMTGVKICGGVQVKDCNFFGIQSIVLQYHNIGSDVRIGANSVIMRDTEDGNLYMGNPAIKTKFGVKK